MGYFLKEMPSAGQAPPAATGRTVSVLGLSSRVRAWSARRSNSCTPSTEAWVQTRIAKGQERRNVHWPLKGKQHSNDHSHSNYSRRHRCRQVRTRRLSRTGRPSPSLRQHQARPPRSAQLAGPARRHPRRLRTHRALPPRAAPVPVRLRCCISLCFDKILQIIPMQGRGIFWTNSLLQERVTVASLTETYGSTGPLPGLNSLLQ